MRGTSRCATGLRFSSVLQTAIGKCCCIRLLRVCRATWRAPLSLSLSLRGSSRLVSSPLPALCLSPLNPLLQH